MSEYNEWIWKGEERKKEEKEDSETQVCTLKMDPSEAWTFIEKERKRDLVRRTGPKKKGVLCKPIPMVVKAAVDYDDRCLIPEAL